MAALLQPRPAPLQAFPAIRQVGAEPRKGKTSGKGETDRPDKGRASGKGQGDAGQAQSKQNWAAS